MFGQATFNTFNNQHNFHGAWISKCKVMHIDRNNPQATYTMNYVILDTTVKERDIGVLVQPSVQCSEASRRANAVLEVVPLQRQEALCATVHPICTPTPGVCPGLVPLDPGRQGHVGEGSAQGRPHGVRTARFNLRGTPPGARPPVPGGPEDPVRHGPGLQDHQGFRWEITPPG